MFFKNLDCPGADGATESVKGEDDNPNLLRIQYKEYQLQILSRWKVGLKYFLLLKEQLKIELSSDWSKKTERISRIL